MIEVGEYIRTNKGDIFEFQRIMESYNGDFYMWGTDYKGCYEKDVKAHSKNIIDLIEVGDFVNGYKVAGIMCGYIYLDKINVETRKTKTLADYQIETILTHELYEQNSYKVGDIE